MSNVKTRSPRTPEQAIQYLNSIAPKIKVKSGWHGDDQIKNLIPIANFHSPRLSNSEVMSCRLRDVPVHKIYTNQERVSIDVVRKKITGDWTRDRPKHPCVLYMKSLDKYIMVDGNHRVNKAILLREHTIKAKVKVIK